MDFNVEKPTNDYQGYAAYFEKTAEEQALQEAAEAAQTTPQNISGEQKLGLSARNALSSIRRSRPEMDIYVADLASGDEAKDLIAKGSKRYAVVISSEEMERIAADPYYGQKKLDGISGMLQNVSEEIEQKRAKEKEEDAQAEEAASSEEEKTGIVRYGIAFTGDGSRTYFAQLGTSSESQKYVLQRIREMTAEKKEVKRLENEIKRTIVQAGSTAELYQKIREVNWEQIEASQIRVGATVNYSV